MVEQHKEIMPDLNCAQVQDATVKIQAAFRGHKARQEIKEAKHVDDSSETEEELPDLMDADVEAATVKIQSAYRGFQTRKKMQDKKEVMPDLNCAEVQDAT